MLKKPFTKPNNFALGLLTAVLLCSCSRNYLSVDTVARINKRIDRYEFETKVTFDKSKAARIHNRLLHVWKGNDNALRILNNVPQYTKGVRIASYYRPYYPVGPLEDKLCGEVVISAFINREGKVETVKVLQSTNSRFEYSASESILNSKFTPAETQEGSTESIVTIGVVFEYKNYTSYGRYHCFQLPPLTFTQTGKSI